MKTVSKTTLLALASSLAISGNVVAADSNYPTFYGKANLSVDATSRQATSAAVKTDPIEVNSNSSRLGFHGDLPLNGQLKAFYRVEYQIDLDDGATVLSARNTVAGVKGGFGSVMVGIHDTPFKKAQGKVDLFSDYDLGDLKSVLESEDREPNTISYMTPSMSGFQGWVMLIPGENNTTDENGQPQDGVADGMSASLTYKGDSFTAAAAINSSVDPSAGNHAGFDGFRVFAQTKQGPFTLGALYQSTEMVTNPASQDVAGYLVSAAFNASKKNVFKVQMTANDEATKDTEMFSIGWDHKFNKASKFYVYFTDLSDDLGRDDSNFGVGLEHNFGKKK